LDKIQCEFTFNPTQFSVAVDVQGLLISVSTLDVQAEDIDPSSRDLGVGFGIVPNMVTQLVASVSATTNLYASALGDSLLASINSTAAILNTSITEPDTISRAVEESLKSMVDDILVSYSSAQLMIAGEINPQLSRRVVPVIAKVDAIRIGERTYVKGTVVLTLAITLAALIELLRTQGWRELPHFDYRNLQHVIVGSWLGGTDFHIDLGAKTKVSSSVVLKSGSHCSSIISPLIVSELGVAAEQDTKEDDQTKSHARLLRVEVEQIDDY
jgi:hypothetical protein